MSNYSEIYLKKIIQLFLDHNVKLEFSDITELIQAFEEVKDFFVDAKLTELFENCQNQYLVEIDISKQQIISVGKSYPYYAAHLCHYKQIRKQLQIIDNILYFNPGSSVGLFDNFAIMYSGDEEKTLEGFYHSLDNKILLNLDKQSEFEVLKQFNISDYHLEFIKNVKQDMFLDYIGFDDKETVLKISLFTTKNNFLESSPQKYLKKYTKIDEILNIITNYFNDEEEGISLQYSPLDQNYFAIEVSFEPINYEMIFTLLHQAKIITDEEFESSMKLVIPPEFINCVLKFRWADQNSLALKLYIEKEIKQ